MKQFAVAAAGVAFANAFNLPRMPGFAKAKFDHFVDVIRGEENTDYNVVITQISGQENFILTASDTYADPNPVKTSNVEHFYVGGTWINPSVTLHDVDFTCLLQGVEVYNQDYLCSDGDANCPSIPATFGQEWKGLFNFDVPGFAPPFQYDVHVKAKDPSGNVLFELESKFYIP